VRTPGLGIVLTLAYFDTALPRPAPSGGKLSVQPIDGRGFLPCRYQSKSWKLKYFVYRR